MSRALTRLGILELFVPGDVVSCLAHLPVKSLLELLNDPSEECRFVGKRED